MRNSIPQTPPIGAPSTTNNIDTVTYQNYVSSTSSNSAFSLSNMTSVQQQQLSQLQDQLDLLSNQITNLTGNFGSGTNIAETQMNANVLGVDDYLTDLSNTNLHKWKEPTSKYNYSQEELEDKLSGRYTEKF